MKFDMTRGLSLSTANDIDYTQPIFGGFTVCPHLTPGQRESWGAMIGDYDDRRKKGKQQKKTSVGMTQDGRMVI